MGTEQEGGRGAERNGFLCFAPGTPRHWPRRSQDPKGPISLARGGGYGGGGMGTGSEREGVAYFYRKPVLTSITLVFFKSMYSAHSPYGIKRPTISRF